MRIFLIFLGIAVALQASDQKRDIVAEIDTLYDKAINVNYSLETFDINKDSQIILPVSHGQYITLPLETIDLFTLDSIGDMIKEMQESGRFYVLASYRSKQKDGISHIKCATAAALLKNIRDKDKQNRREALGKYFSGQWKDGDVVTPPEDPFTRLPIAKIDFHEFCYINKMLAVRYLGSTKKLREPLNVMLDCLTSNPGTDALNPNLAMVLSLVHAKKGDFGRALKYIVDISEECPQNQHEGVFQIAHFAIWHKHNDVAIQALRKVSSGNMHAPLLLYKLMQSKNDADQTLLHNLSIGISGALQGVPDVYSKLGQLYWRESMQIGQKSDIGEKFGEAAGVTFVTAAEKNNDVRTSFDLLCFVSMLDSHQDPFYFVTPEQIKTYANQVIDAINSGSLPDQIIRLKERRSDIYQGVVQMLKKYGTKSLLATKA